MAYTGEAWHILYVLRCQLDFLRAIQNNASPEEVDKLVYASRDIHAMFIPLLSSAAKSQQLRSKIALQYRVMTDAERKKMRADLIKTHGIFPTCRNSCQISAIDYPTLFCPWGCKTNHRFFDDIASDESDASVKSVTAYLLLLSAREIYQYKPLAKRPLIKQKLKALDKSIRALKASSRIQLEDNSPARRKTFFTWFRT